MGSMSDIERVVIEYVSLAGAAVLFGSLNENFVKPIELAISSGYGNVKAVYRKAADSLEKYLGN